MNTVCLLIHGLGGTPFELTWIAKALSVAGVGVQAVTLPGHGSTVEAYGASRFSHWVEHVEQSYAALAGQGKRVIVVGFSLGGILALHLAQHFSVAGVVTLATPVYLYKIFPYFTPERRLFLLPLVARWRKVEYHPPRSALSREIAPWEGHEGLVFPPQIMDFVQGMARVRAGLGRVTAPLLCMQARGDTTCNVYNAVYIARHVASAHVQLTILTLKEKRVDQHLLVTHRECRDTVAAEVARFACALAQ